MISEISFAASLIIILVVERFTSAFAFLIAGLVVPRSYSSLDGSYALTKNYASVQMVGSGASLAASMGSSVIATLISAFNVILSYVFLALIVTTVFSFLYIAQEYYPEIMIQGVNYWNDYIGPYAEALILAPLQVANTLFSSITPVFNYFSWITTSFLYNSLVGNIAKDMGTIVELGDSLAGFTKSSVVGMADYVPKFIYPCSTKSDTCYDPGERTYNFITPISELRRMAVAISKILDNMCAGITGPADIILYPLLDINTAKAVHNIGNSILYSIIHIPSVTYQRCKDHGNGGENLVMCLPDFEPPTNMLVAGLRNLGDMLDNWLDVSSIIVQESLGIDTNTDCDSLALSLTPANYSRSLFGTNEVRVVGLTEGLYAVTDGKSIQYFNHYGSTESIIAVDAWPIQVDVSMGIAAVTFYDQNPSERDRNGNPSTAMLGCSCSDSEGFMKIKCAIALYEGQSYGTTTNENVGVPDLTFNVVFDKRSTANYMTCLSSEISIQSVRWPSNRFTKNLQTERDFESTCQSKSTCNVIDATIWVAPLCAAGSQSTVCVETFKDAACYPYCMAARKKGSGSEGLVLYNAPDWRERVHIIDRDCAVSLQVGEVKTSDIIEKIKDGVFQYSNGTTTNNNQVSAETLISNDFQGFTGSSVKNTAWDPDLGCSSSKNSRSVLLTNSVPGYKTNKYFRSILMPGQPFSISGDTTLTTRRDVSGRYFISVERLFGNEVNEFTMVNIQRDYPASPPPDTPEIGGLTADDIGMKLPTPYSFSRVSGIRHPSGSSQGSLFYAVNPSLAMFQALASGCRTNGQVWKTQLAALSSYAPIRIWKVKPYVFCPKGIDGRSGCENEVGRAESVKIPGAFTEMNERGESVFNINQCYRPFAVKVTSIEYINQENMAVTVLEAPFTEFNPETGLLEEWSQPALYLNISWSNVSKSRYRVYFMSTVTMGLSDVPWNREDLQSTRLAQGKLCPAMRRMPNVGSMVTELGISFVNLLRPATRIIVSLPGLIDIWKKGRSCSVVTHGHSLLRSCGARLFSLDDFFDSLGRANSHFWASFGIVAGRVRDMGSDEVANVIDGVAYFGHGTTIALAGGSRYLLTSFKMPISEVQVGVMSSIMPAGAKMFSASSFLTVSPLRIAAFSYNLITDSISEIIPLAIKADRNKKDKTALREILFILTNNLYESRGDYNKGITMGMLQSCAGLSLMIGYTNPWAILLRKQCETSAIALQGVMDLFLALIIDVPFAKCLCVDAAAAGSSFEDYAMNNCFYFAPNHIKPFMLGMIQNAVLDKSKGIEKSCLAVTDFAVESFTNSMKPYFTLQLQATDQIASSVDFLIKGIDKNAGRCMDFETNPYATVIMPEPVDYFSACGRTSMCGLKCAPEFDAFDQALLAHSNAAVGSTVINKEQESLFFVDLDEDAYTPMQILAMVHLSDCRPVCGGGSDTSEEETVKQQTEDLGNRDNCIAIAGIIANSSISIMKYCIPKSLNQGVRSEPSETWSVWYSELWSDTLIDLKFTDTVYGDTVIAYRDNRGGSDSYNSNVDKGPAEEFVSIHPRIIQSSNYLFQNQYSTGADRSQRLILASSSSEISGVVSTEKEILSISSMHVIPTDDRGRMPWIFLTVVLMDRPVVVVNDDGEEQTIDTSSNSITESTEVEVCGRIDIQGFIANRGVLDPPLSICDLNNFLLLNRQAGYIPVSFMSLSILTAQILLVPSKPDYDVQLVEVNFQNSFTVGSVTRRSFKTPSTFTSNSKVPTYESWSQEMSRNLLLTSRTRNSGTTSTSSMPSITRQRVAVISQRVLAQNTIQNPLFLSRQGETGVVSIFTSNDRDIPTHWLSQIRISILGGVGSSEKVLLSEIRSSQLARVSVTVLHSCDRNSCLGCKDLNLQTLCYAAQQCSVVRCIGTVVNQKYFLCDVGLAVQSMAEQVVSLMLGAWLVFTETYTDILRMGLNSASSGGREKIRKQGISIDWADDAFFGYVCSTKDMFGQMTGTLTAAIGAGLIYKNQAARSTVDIDGGSAELDNHFTATVTMILNGVNSFLYQLCLFPLYPLIATQKAFICNANSILAIADISGGFSVKLGRGDLQNASSTVSGQCMTSYMDSLADESGRVSSRESLAVGATDLLTKSRSSTMEKLSNQASSRIGSAIGSFTLTIPMHFLDAMITWAMGVVSGLQDMAQIFDSRNCDVPDYYIYKSTTCACGDDPVQIPLVRRMDSMHWCTGTLRMLDGFGKSTYIYNPYTFEQLRSMLSDGKMDSYLECISKKAQNDKESVNGFTRSFDCNTIKPRDTLISPQGVTLISVFQRCKANYQQKQWDEGAFLMYDQEKLFKSIRGIPVPQALDSSEPGSVGECLLTLSQRGEGSNLACFQDHVKMPSAVYWRYDRLISVDESNMNIKFDSSEIDACIVFSGPAKSTKIYEATSLAFKKCSADYTDSGCRIPHVVWSSSSKNKVPVANLHMLDDSSDAGRARMAARLFQEAHDTAEKTLKELENYANKNLRVILFSGEGDSLHQIFDCIMQGPYSKVDLWARGSGKELPVPSWARDAGGLGLTRDMDLPCIGSKLKGDPEPPFTCGGDTRRSIIKTFVRDYINNGGKENNGNTHTEELIRERIKELQEVWSDVGKYPCLCPDGVSHNFNCCVLYLKGSGDIKDSTGCEEGFYENTTAGANSACLNNFMPPAFSLSFDEISGDDVIRKIISRIPGFLRGIFTDDSAKAFKAYNDPEVVKSWKWEDSSMGELARSDGIYSSYSPIVNYSSGEVGSPFRNERSIWYMCTGLISQVMMTMPMSPISISHEDVGDNQNTIMWTASTVHKLQGFLKFDPSIKRSRLVHREDSTENKEDPTSETFVKSNMELYVEKLLADSFADASTFWHYAIRHVPSDSLICAKDYSTTKRIKSGNLRFTNVPGGGSGASNIDALGIEGKVPNFKMNGYSAFPLGGVDHECFCGWEYSSNFCIPPSDVCLVLTNSSSCPYKISDQEVWVSNALKIWDGGKGLACPDMDLSDSWGIVTNNHAQEWMTTTSKGLVSPTLLMSVGDMMASGRSGLRIGNAQTLLNQARLEGVSPENRVNNLTAPRDEDEDNPNRGKGGRVSLRICSDKILSTFDAQSLVNDVVQDLFPASQAIEESAPMSSCLRYSIEYAKVRMLESIGVSIRDTSNEMMYQEPIVRVWKRRCEAQLELVGVCRSNSVFDMIPLVKSEVECPFVISDDYYASKPPKDYYVTTGCMVFIASATSSPVNSMIRGAFFNPCRLPSDPCSRKASVSLAELLLVTNIAFTRLPFDPRLTGSREAIWTWPDDVEGKNFRGLDPSANERQSDVLRRFRENRNSLNEKDEIPWRLSTEFVSKVVESGGSRSPGATGNTRLAWSKAEGMDSNAGEFCDGIADWWPEDWSMPAGYHVTMPCNSQQTGYRTFDSAFVVERPGSDDQVAVTMRYVHTAVRDPEAYHSRFGTAGFCRRGNYGMPQFVTNTMRICTVDSVNVTYDATVPVKPRFNNGVEEFSNEEYCSDSPYEVPWSIDKAEDSHPSMFTVGNAPMYRGEYAGTTNSFPLPVRSREIRNTHPGSRHDSWGLSCTDGDLLECSASKPCVSLDPSSSPLRCVRGVCVKDDPRVCYMHSDCKSKDMLCTGNGRCSTGTWQVENNFEKTDIDFELYSDNCKSQSFSGFSTERYDMYGSSPWQRVPDVLEMYGMCSYRNWYEYLEFVDPEKGKGRDNLDGRCDGLSRTLGCQPESFNVDTSIWWDTGRPYGNDNMPSVWERGKFKVEAHPCDRDYMHAKGMAGCSPVILNDNSAMGIVKLSTKSQTFSLARSPRTRNAQTIERFSIEGLANGTESFSRFINMIGRPTLTNLADKSVYRSTGFLGTKSAEKGKFRDCKSIDQCFVDDFTYHGVNTVRKVAKPDAGIVKWGGVDTDACGGFGILLDPLKNPVACAVGSSVDEGKYSCCLLDQGVAPLHRLMCGSYGNGSSITVDEDIYNFATREKQTVKVQSVNSLDYLTKHCSRYSNPFSESSTNLVGSQFSSDIVRDTCKKLKPIYLVDKFDARKKDAKIGEIRDALNSLLDLPVARSPPVTGDSYLQVTSCSLAMYRAIQASTECTKDDKTSIDTASTITITTTTILPLLNPFCTDYHTAIDSTTKSTIGRSSIYYFLSYTMQEIPFAWWHKCMALQGKRFSIQAQADVIQCSEWNVDTITGEDLDTVKYDDATMEKLGRIEAAISPVQVEEALALMKWSLEESVNLYVQGGYPGGSSSSRMSRNGVSSSYSLSCTTDINYKPADVMKKMHEDAPRVSDCMMDILEWSFFDIRQDPLLFMPYNYLASRGARGVAEDCYTYDESTRAYLPQNTMEKPMKYIQSLLLNRALDSKGSIRMHRSIKGNDFSVPSSNSFGGGGLLLGEFIPDDLDPGEVPDISRRVSDAVGPQTASRVPSGEMNLRGPCINLPDVEKRLPMCDEPSPIILLEERHCNMAYDKGASDIREFSKPVVLKGTNQKPEEWYRFPPKLPGLISLIPCLFGCGGTENWEDVVHPGLSADVEGALIQMLDAQRDACVKLVPSRTICYDYNNVEINLEGEKEKAIQKIMGLPTKDTGLLFENLERDVAKALDGESEADFKKRQAEFRYAETKGYLVKDCNGKKTTGAALETVYKDPNTYEQASSAEAIDTLKSNFVTAPMGILVEVIGSRMGPVKSETYDCEITYRSTGNNVVDGVMQRLHWTDAQYSLKDEDGARALLLKTIIGPIFDFMKDCGDWISDKCLPSDTRLSRKHHFYPLDTPEVKSCFRISKPKGLFDCKFMANQETGLLEEVKEVSSLAGTRIQSAATGKMAEWSVMTNRALDVNVKNDYYDVEEFERLIYTLYVRMMKHIVSFAEKSATSPHVKPMQLPFHLDNPDYIVNFEGFDLIPRRQFEQRIKQDNHNCETGPIINYGVCSENYLERYNEAKRDSRQFILKDSATIIPSGSVLVWPGIPLSQHLGNTIAAWSKSARPSSQVFVEWIFNKEKQCKLGTADNSVCTTVALDETYCLPTQTADQCYPLPNQYSAVNPWLGGDFNPWISCDTSNRGSTVDTTSGGQGEGVNEHIDNSCHPKVCDPADVANTPAYYSRMPNKDYCRLNKGKSAETINVEYSYDSNLCRKKPLPASECKWNQGQAAQGLKGEPVLDLYSNPDLRHSNKYLSDQGQGLFMHGGNPIYFTSKASPDDILQNIQGILRQSLDDIGGHHVVFKTASDRITGERFMYIDRTPLSLIETPIKSSQDFEMPALQVYEESKISDPTGGNYGWLSNLGPTMRSESIVVDPLYPIHENGFSNKRWLCPLRRTAFWTSLVDDFNPLIPSPVRAARLFGKSSGLGMNHDTRSHPSQLFEPLRSLANVFTTNGFCLCTTATDCMIPNSISRSSPLFECSLAGTVESLYDQKYRLGARVLSPSKCDIQLDWPYESGTMRDGMTTDTMNNDVKCNVLDRLPPFKYRYMPKGKVMPSPDDRTTLDEGGSCHMAPAAKMPPRSEIPASVETKYCRTIYKNSSHLVARCETTYGHEDLTMERERSKPPHWMIDYMKKTKRQKCGTCSPLPKWMMEESSTRQLDDPEVSYGKPFRWSASRLVASDIKAAICGGQKHQNNPECAALLNVPEWTLDKFMGNIVTNPENLLKNPPDILSAPPGSVRDTLPLGLASRIGSFTEIEEEELWGGPDASWVACNQYNGTCYGGVKKEDWYSPNRGDKCLNEFQAQVLAGKVNSSTVGIDICDLDSKLNNLCIDLATSREKIFQANCIIKGACSPQVYTYTPGMYSITNQDFVRGTVENFYEMYGINDTDLSAFIVSDNEDRVCPAEDEDLDLAIRNEDFLRACASKQLEKVQLLLRIVRRLLHLIVETTYYIFCLIISLLKLMLPLSGETQSEILAEAQFYFLKLVQLTFESMKEIANLIFQMIFDMGGFGEAMKIILKMLCEFANIVYQAWNWTGCWLCKNIINPIVSALIDILRPVLAMFSPAGNGILGFLIFIKRLIDGFTCSGRIPCDFADRAPSYRPLGTLPVASRCWADYAPEVDESDTFSCTRSDTCRVSTLEAGVTALEFGGLATPNREILCTSCPHQTGGYVNPFGCDTATKQCTCNRPKRDRTLCTSNDQCYIQGETTPSTCALVSDFTTGYSYGSTECQSCSRPPTCHITNARKGIGVCSCMQFPVPVMSCSPSYVGRTVMPDASQMCAVTTSEGSALSSWSALATAPCALVSSGSAYCYNVGEYGYLVVGRDGVFSSGSSAWNRRRLLSLNNSYDFNSTNRRKRIWGDEEDQIVLKNQILDFGDDWSHVSEPCSSLIYQYSMKMNISLPKRSDQYDEMEMIPMGVMDQITLRKCVHWRIVGRKFIKKFFNFTTEEEDFYGLDNFLLSLGDFTTVIRKKKNSLMNIMNTGSKGFRFILMNSQQQEGSSAIMETLKIVTEVYAKFHLEKEIIMKLNWTEYFNLGDNEKTKRRHNDKNNKKEFGFIKNFIQDKADHINLISPFTSSGPSSHQNENYMRRIQKEDDSVHKIIFHRSKKLTTQSDDENMNNNNRKILQSTKEDIYRYSSLISISGNAADFSLSSSISDAWLEGSFSWPPKFEYWNGESPCIIYETMKDNVMVSTKILAKYYTTDSASRNRLSKAPAWEFISNLPRFYNGTPVVNDTLSFTQSGPAIARSSNENDNLDLVAIYYNFFIKYILGGFAGITPASVQAFFGSGRGLDPEKDGITMGYLINEALTCDFEGIMMCSNHNRNIITSFIVAYAIYWVISSLLSFLGIQGLSYFAWILIPILALWLSYGLSPICFPMIPTCLVDDIINVTEAVIPSKIIWPQLLQVYPNCLGQLKEQDFPTKDSEQEKISGKNCMRSCREYPFYFRSWESTLAWITCNLFGPDKCQNVEIPYFPDFQKAANNMSLVLNQESDQDSIDAFTFCFWITIAQGLPWLFLAILVVYLGISLITIPFTIASTIIQTIFQVIAFTHVGLGQLGNNRNVQPI